MTQCTHCAGRAQLFLCNACISDLRDMLIGLARGQQLPNGQYAAGWLEHLTDAVLGQTKLGEFIRRNRGDETPMRVNLRASQLLDYASSVLSEWCRDVCETRGITWRPLKATEPGFIGPLRSGWRRLPADYQATSSDKALWLSGHVSAVASEEAAFVCYREIAEIITDIERLINRPTPPRLCGPCPTMINHDVCGRREPHSHPHSCATQLMAKHDAIELTCPACKTTHNMERLLTRLWADADNFHVARNQVVWAMAMLGQPISLRTFQQWCAEHHLKPLSGYAEPRYLLGDVRKLRDAKPQKALTGKLAHKSKKAG